MYLGLIWGETTQSFLALHGFWALYLMLNSACFRVSSVVLRQRGPKTGLGGVFYIDRGCLARGTVNNPLLTIPPPPSTIPSAPTFSACLLRNHSSYTHQSCYASKFAILTVDQEIKWSLGLTSNERRKQKLGHVLKGARSWRAPPLDHSDSGWAPCPIPAIGRLG